MVGLSSVLAPPAAAANRTRGKRQEPAKAAAAPAVKDDSDEPVRFSVAAII